MKNIFLIVTSPLILVMYILGGIFIGVREFIKNAKSLFKGTLNV